MTGLYIHIPFCRSRCVYCGFYSTTSLEWRQRYVDAICREIQLRGERLEVRGERSEVRGERSEVRGERNDLCRETIETIYLGGGTPSQLTSPQLHQIFETIYNYNKVGADAEVTIECNPDDLTAEFAAMLQQLPVNRVSMGAQTFDDRRLHFLRRRHSAAQVASAVARLREAGIQNISIDLMYGFPGETLESWIADIDQALSLNVEHISTYCLMYEEGTPLYRLLEQDRVTEIDEELERKMYYTLIDRLTAAGYEHYEISNFARLPSLSFRSRHNSSYWKGVPYIGIGAAAHSYDIRSRSWNVADIHRYIEGMERGERIFDEELLDDDTRYNDTVTVALRTCEGIDLSTLSEHHRDYCLQNARRFIDDGLLELTHQSLRLTRRGLFVSDMVMSELMMV